MEAKCSDVTAACVIAGEKNKPHKDTEFWGVVLVVLSFSGMCSFEFLIKCLVLLTISKIIGKSCLNRFWRENNTERKIMQVEEIVLNFRSCFGGCFCC